MIILDILILIFLYPLSLAVAWLYLLALVGLIGQKDYPQQSRRYKFLILVPAHNEAATIGPTLERLNALEDRDGSKIVVIADNCDDDTATVAAGYNVEVLVRDNPDARGKGYALEWAIGQFALDDYDAVAIVDADTLVKPDMLRVMTRSFETGAGAVQLDYVFYVAEDTPLAQIQAVANRVENRFFYKPRAIMGLPVLLRGTGMAIKSDVLVRLPWDSHSITEDVDYSVKLIQNRVRIDYSVAGEIQAPATSSYDQSYTQKLRWASGTFGLIRDRIMPLIGQGLKQGRIDLIELALSFLLLSRPALIYLTLIPLLLSLAVGGPLGTGYLLWSLFLIGLLVVYLISGVFLVPQKGKALAALAHVPKFGFWFLKVQLEALFRHRKVGWDRTERKANRHE